MPPVLLAQTGCFSAHALTLVLRYTIQCVVAILKLTQTSAGLKETLARRKPIPRSCTWENVSVSTNGICVLSFSSCV